MIFKSFSFNFKDILKKNYILLYGENLSLISEIENKIIIEAKAQLGLIPKRYQEDYLIKNPELFHQILNSDALFGEQEFIIIGKTSDKIMEILEFESTKKYEKKIIFLSHALTKKSKLRTISENSKNFASIACYNDTLEQLQNILAQKLKDNKITVSRELLNSIFETNSLNRQDINDAVDKLQLMQKSFIITDNILKNIFHSSNESSNFEIVNYCLLGDKKKISQIFRNIYSQGINFNEILAALKYKVNKLIEILESNSNALNINNLVDSYKPPIFWKEKNIIKDQLNRWNAKELYKLQNIIFETEIECKTHYEISSTILQQFIITTSTKTCLENKFS